MPTWPAGLPSLAAGLKETRQAGFIRTPTDTGPAKARRRFSAVSRFASGTVTLSQAQRVTFETFYTTTISEGSLAFDWTDPHTGTTESFRFVAPPIITPMFGDGTKAAYNRIQLSLEILP